MIFRKKYLRGMELLRKKNGKEPEQPDAENREIETIKRVRADDDIKPEKHDVLAMLISAFMIFVPVALIVLLVMCLPILLTALLS